MKFYNLPISVTWEDDTFIARCSLVQGAFAEGETPQEAIRELIEVMKMISEYKKEKYDMNFENEFDRSTEFTTSIPVALT